MVLTVSMLILIFLAADNCCFLADYYWCCNYTYSSYTMFLLIFWRSILRLNKVCYYYLCIGLIEYSRDYGLLFLASLGYVPGVPYLSMKFIVFVIIGLIVLLSVLKLLLLVGVIGWFQSVVLSLELLLDLSKLFCMFAYDACGSSRLDMVLRCWYIDYCLVLCYF